MKKPKQFSMPPLFKRDKDMLSIMNDPKKMKALKEVVDQAAKVSENIKPKFISKKIKIDDKGFIFILLIHS